jgi:multisubunit Na+/H+ antiporter MnhG subunit
MTARDIAVDVLLALAVAIVLISSVGLLVMRDAYQKIHYLTPAGMVAPVVVGAAVLVRSGLTLDTAETGLALLFVLIFSPFLTHATIRAVRVRETGDWRPAAGHSATDDSSARDDSSATADGRAATGRRGRS